MRMSLRTSISGSIPALVTPMNADGSVDHGCLRELVEWHIAEGSDALVAVGTTGESATLDVPEHSAVIATVVHVTNGRVPVIAGTGANATAEAISLTKMAASLGADAALLVTPYYNKPPQDGLYAHYSAIAESCDIPQILYNVPGRTGCDLLPETVSRLLVHERIVAIKEAKGELPRIRELLALGQGLAVFSGDDPTARESILLGAHGDISVTANIAPRLMHEMCAAAQRGDTETAERLDAQLSGLHRDLFCQPNPIAVKWALQHMGRIPTGIRLPLIPLAPQYFDTVTSALAQAGITDQGTYGQ